MDLEHRSMKILSSNKSKLFAAGVVGFVALALYFAWMRRLNPVRGLPYRDGFAAGQAAEWKAFGGTWELASGTIRNDSDERGAKLMTGSTQWKDYSVEADVMLLGLGGDAGLLIRSD